MKRLTNKDVRQWVEQIQLESSSDKLDPISAATLENFRESLELAAKFYEAQFGTGPGSDNFKKRNEIAIQVAKEHLKKKGKQG